MEKLNTFFQAKQINTVLDVGTGAGNFIAVLKDAFPNVAITGVDPSVDAIKNAAEIYPNVTFREMTGEQLIFPDNNFDVASISMALHHLPDINKTLSEMQRVVKKGGYIIVNELFSDNLNNAQKVHKLMHHFRSKVDRLCGVCHNETFTKQEVLDVVSSSQLEILLHFENQKAAKPLSSVEIEERSAKMQNMLDQVQEKTEYAELAKEAEQIRAALQQYGFQMATRVVIVAQVC